MEGEQGMGLTRCSFTCHILSSTGERAKVFYGVASTYQQHLRQKQSIAKKHILTIRAIMISQEVDLVAGDFNGTAWRCALRNGSTNFLEHRFLHVPYFGVRQ